jgi:hypothetical protein
VDIIEGLDGSWTVSLIDVQGSGSGAGRKLAISLLSFMNHLISGGVDITSALDATHSHLKAMKAGKVGASVHLVRVSDDTIQVAGFGKLAAWVLGDPPTSIQLTSNLAGISDKPEVAAASFAIHSVKALVLGNDGVATSADEISRLTQPWAGDVNAHEILSRSIAQDSGRARSDKTVVVITQSQTNGGSRIRAGSQSFVNSSRLVQP